MSLVGVIELTLGGRGPKQGFVFDPHRLAFPCWASVGRGLVLVTLDRHFDTVPPLHRVIGEASLAELEHFAHTQLDVRNYDHLLAAMDASILSHAIIIARARPVGAVVGPQWVDGGGQAHELISAPTVDALACDFGRRSASEASRRAEQVLREASGVILDIDLDCFTSPSDADPTTVVPWPLEVIRQHVRPPGSDDFWDLVLSKCVALTFAREPSHCGGLVAAGRLFEQASQVIFRELLETDLP